MSGVMSASPSRMLRFEAFTLDISRGVLLRGASELPLRRQTFEVLRYLAEHAGHVVSSEELIEALWTSKPADANASTGQCIKEIRRALGVDGRWIVKTVSGRGYEFKAEITAAEPSPSEHQSAPEVAGHSPSPIVAAKSAESTRLGSWTVRSQSLLRLCAVAALTAAVAVSSWLLWPPPRPSAPSALTMMAAPTIAVLPFRTMGVADDKGNPTGAIGEEIRSELARASPGLDLVIKSAVEHGKRQPFAPSANIVPEVRYVVLGTSWQQQGIQHVNIQLTEADSAAQIWAEAFAFEHDQPGAQSRTAALIARQIAVWVRHTEVGRPLPETPEAGHFALQGFALLESERGSQLTLPARTLFEKALSLDANSIPALHGQARLKISMATGGAWMLPWEWRTAMLNEAEAAIERMLKRDPRNVAVHSLRGSLLRARGDVDHAVAAFELALSINPNDSQALAELGRTKIDAGRAQEAMAHLEAAIRLSPTDPLIYLRYFWAGMAAVHISDNATAVKWLLKARQANRSYPHSALWLAVAYYELGDEEKAKAMMAEYRMAAPSFTIAGWKKYHATNNVTVAERRKRIEKVLRRLVPEIASVEAEHTYTKSQSCAGFREFC